MNDTLDLLYELCDMTTNKLWMLKEKFSKNNREIPSNDVDLFDKLTHSLKSIKTTIAMMESEEDVADIKAGRAVFKIRTYESHGKTCYSPDWQEVEE